MRLAFQVALLVAAFIPFLLGAMSLFQGAARLLPNELITTELDGQVRFWGIRSMLPFLLAIWIVANLEKAYAVLVIILAATAAGGLARAYAAVEYGAPQPALVGVIAFEIGAVLFIPWYRSVMRQAKKNYS
ncbi:DUF4345 family protein [Oricola sp.]|uniref:DUF4345 family protein n=1 Tax=Oricola sp. TaxID=1979950 RepID=UPI003BAA79E1